MKGEVLSDAVLLIHEADTVATTIDDLEAGREITYADRTITLTEDVPFGHKVALVPLAEGDEVRKYGEVIGKATEPVEAGAWVHTHNCESTRGRGDLAAAGEGGVDA